MRSRVRIIVTAIALSAPLTSAEVYAQRSTPVEVTNAAVRIPVVCNAFFVGPADRSAFDNLVFCVRQDDRTRFQAVPEGHSLAITDFLVTRTTNFSNASDRFSIVFVRTGTDGLDNVTFEGTLSGFNSKHYVSPPAVLRGGETAGIGRVGLAPVEQSLAVTIVGYLVKTPELGRQ